jgi:pentatricopeptide repeat protein
MLFKAHAKRGQIDKALELKEEMENRGIPLEPRHLGIILWTYYCAMQYDSMESLIFKLSSSGLADDYYIVTILIRIYAGREQFGRLKVLYTNLRLKKTAIEIPKRVYCSLMFMTYKSDPIFTQQVFADFLRAFPMEYDIIIEMYSRLRQLNKLDEMWSKLSRNDSLTHRTIKAFVTGYGALRCFRMVKVVYNYAVENDIPLLEDTYIAIIIRYYSAILNNDVNITREDLDRLMTDFRNKDMVLPPLFYEEILKLPECRNNIAASLRILDMMKKNKINPTSSVYLALIRCSLWNDKAHSDMLIEDILTSIAEKKVLPSILLYSQMIRICQTRQQMERIFGDMKLHGLLPIEIQTANYLFMLYETTDDPDGILEYFLNQGYLLPSTQRLQRLLQHYAFRDNIKNVTSLAKGLQRLQRLTGVEYELISKTFVKHSKKDPESVRYMRELLNLALIHSISLSKVTQSNLLKFFMEAKDMETVKRLKRLHWEILKDEEETENSNLDQQFQGFDEEEDEESNPPPKLEEKEFQDIEINDLEDELPSFEMSIWKKIVENDDTNPKY